MIIIDAIQILLRTNNNKKLTSFYEKNHGSFKVAIYFSFIINQITQVFRPL